MPAGEIIFGAIGELIGYIIVDVIIEGIGKLIRAVYYGIRKIITGKEREIPELKRIEKRYLNKQFRLKSDFNGYILKGTRGTIIKIIDKQNLHVEFEGFNGKSIMKNDKQVFKIERKRITLEKREKRTHNTNYS
jgi:hypothetical protein